MKCKTYLWNSWFKRPCDTSVIKSSMMIRSALSSCTLSCTGIQPLSWIARCNYSLQSSRITYLMWSTSKEYRHLRLLLRAIANWHMFPTANVKNGGRVITNAALHSGSQYDPNTTVYGAGCLNVTDFNIRRQLISWQGDSRQDSKTAGSPCDEIIFGRGNTLV